MPRTVITHQQAGPAGLAPTFEAANAAGNAVLLRPARAVWIKNGSAAAVTVTIPTPGTVDGLAITDRAVSVPAAGETIIGLGQGDAYRQPDGTAWIDYSAVTSVTAAVLDVP